MSDQRAGYHTKPNLRLVGRDPEQTVSPLVGDAEKTEKAALSASAVLGKAVMHAAMSWVACCMEKQGESVDVMPLSGGLFDAEVHLAGGGSMWLRVRLILEAGPVLSTRVEPIHP